MRACKLEVPAEAGHEEQPLFNEEDTLVHVMRCLGNRFPKKKVQGIITMQDGQTGNSEQARTLEAELRKDYEDIVLCDRIWPDRPIRGPFGEVKIELVPGAIAKKERPYTHAR